MNGCMTERPCAAFDCWYHCRKKKFFRNKKKKRRTPTTPLQHLLRAQTKNTKGYLRSDATSTITETASTRSLSHGLIFAWTQTWASPNPELALQPPQTVVQRSRKLSSEWRRLHPSWVHKCSCIPGKSKNCSFRSNPSQICSRRYASCRVFTCSGACLHMQRHPHLPFAPGKAGHPSLQGTNQSHGRFR